MIRGLVDYALNNRFMVTALAVLLLVWGAISAANALVQGPASFYLLRFLLGVAEAGFFPGMIYYLTLWFPQAFRARFTGTISERPAGLGRGRTK